MESDGGCKQDEIIEMLELLIDNIWWTIGVPVGTGCAPLLADVFLYACEADFLQGFLMGRDRKLAQIHWFYIPLYEWFSVNDQKQILEKEKSLKISIKTCIAKMKIKGY